MVMNLKVDRNVLEMYPKTVLRWDFLLRIRIKS